MKNTYAGVTFYNLSNVGAGTKRSCFSSQGKEKNDKIKKLLLDDNGIIF